MEIFVVKSNIKYLKKFKKLLLMFKIESLTYTILLGSSKNNHQLGQRLKKTRMKIFGVDIIVLKNSVY